MGGRHVSSGSMPDELEVVKYCDACGEPVVVVLTRDGPPPPLFLFCDEHADQETLDDA